MRIAEVSGALCLPASFLIMSVSGGIMSLAEEDKGYLETAYLESIPGMKESILEGMDTPVEDCIPASEIEW